MRARIAGAVVAACVAVLLADAIVAGWRAPRDDKLVQTLERQVKSDASLAPALAGELQRITATRQARRRRDHAVAWVLVGAAGLFLIYVKRAPVPVAAARGRGVDQSVDAARRSACATGCAPEIDLAFVDSLVAEFGPGKEMAIVLLQAIQAHYRYLPDLALRRLCEITEITPAQIAGTSSFYGQFRRAPVGEHIVRVCHGTACHVAGARQISDEVRRFLSIPDGADTDAARQFTVEEVACLGCCSLAPVLMVDGQTAGRLTPAAACHVLAPIGDTERV